MTKAELRAAALAWLELVRERKAAYQIKFGSGDPADLVREDLADFCRANESTWNPDARLHARLEGRRDVWLRIWQFLELEPEELLRLYDPALYRALMDTSKDDEPS